jgi:hypothetical protein
MPAEHSVIWQRRNVVREKLVSDLLDALVRDVHVSTQEDAGASRDYR